MKRLVDLVLSLLLALVLAPVLITVAIVVRWKLGSPVLFRQKRAGLHGELFWLVKFRTMRDDVGGSEEARSDAARLTRFGKLLRSTSLDELPELWNVLRGEISLVGPRPLLEEYLPLYSARQMRRHEVRPGITGWAQVNGRNSLSWEDRFELDVWYVDNRSLWLDARILLMTVVRVFKREGISAEGEVTMTRFTGSGNVPEKTEGGQVGM